MRFGILLGIAATGVLAAPAFAADLPAATPLPMPSAATEAAPANNWTGFYLGVLGGYGWANTDTDAVGDVSAQGFDVGGYAGANWQWGNFVVGAEGDVLYPWRDDSNDGIGIDQGLNGSLRARAGIALDRFLLYGTAGGAMTDLEVSDPTSSDDATLLGWTAGAGVEGMITNNVTARVEYRFSDYEDKTFDLDSGPVDTNLQTHTIHGGIGLKF